MGAKARLIELPIGHFDVYLGEWFERSAASRWRSSKAWALAESESKFLTRSINQSRSSAAPMVLFAEAI